MYAYIYEYIYLYVFTYTYIRYILQKMRNKIYVYLYTYGRIMISLCQKQKHVITKKKEIFSRKDLASTIANMVNIIKGAIAE